MKPKKIVVVGSTNMDMVVRAAHIPVPGETVLGSKFLMNPGGKGANQAVTAAKLGGEVTFVSKVGNDIFGKQSLKLLKEEGINSSFLESDDDLPSGVALITVDEAGENSIVVASGANGNLTTDDVARAIDLFDEETIVLIQLEIPMATVQFAVENAHKSGSTVILNPAPMNNLSSELLRCINILTPNETESEMLTGIRITGEASAREAAQAICAKGVNTVIITLGDMGAYVYDNNEGYLVAAPKVNAIDTTAAGDVFNGALTVAISEKKPLRYAVEFAIKAASISVTRMGAQSSVPFRNELLI